MAAFPIEFESAYADYFHVFQSHFDELK